MPYDWQRDKDRSVTSLGQYVHDVIDRDFDCSDMDLLASRIWVARAASTQVLRVFEQKERHQEKDLSNGSHGRILPLLAKLIWLGVEKGLVAEGSRVLAVLWDDSEAERARLGRGFAPPRVLRISPFTGQPELYGTGVRSEYDFVQMLRCR